MSTGMIELMKRAALDAIDSSQPTDLRFGTVVSVDPLRVKVSNQLTLPSASLIVPQHLTNYNVNVSINWGTDNSGEHTHTMIGSIQATSGGTGESSFESHTHDFSGSVEASGGHNHNISGTRTMLIHGALNVGDKVALLRKQGGQSYFILDRI